MPHTGSRSGLVANRTATWNGVAQSFLGVMQPGVTYNVSAWIRLVSGSSQSASLTVQKTDGSGTTYQNVASGTATSSGWTQLSGTYSPSVSGTLTGLTLYMEGPGSNVNFYADDFVVQAQNTGLSGEIDASVTRQTIEGFGGAICFYNSWVTSHPYKLEIYTNLFKGLNLGILRLGNWFRYQGTVNFDPEAKDFVTNATRILGRPVAIEMSSWSPPAFLKSNGTTTDGGTLVFTNGGFAYTNFANYWYDSLLWYKTNGVVPTYISIQNEPDWAASWDTCIFHPTEDTVNGTNYASYALALQATYQRLSTLPSPPKILGPETAGIGYNSVQNYAAYMNLNHIYGVAHHLYNGGTASSPDSFISAMTSVTNVFPGKPKFQTEYDGIDMLQTALLIHNSMVVEDASAYLFWSLIWPTGGSGLINQENPWQQGSWTYPHGYTIDAKYYAMKHFSYFVTPGYRRVETEGVGANSRFSAYLAPDNSRLVIVLINTGSSSSDAALALNGFTWSTSAVYQTVGTNAQVSQFAALGSAPADLEFTLPGYSLTTVVLDATSTPVFAGPATNPNPSNGAINVPTSATMSWLAGSNATAHRVYFGYSSNAVVSATTNSTEYKGAFGSASYTPPALAASGRFFWRVDEAAGTNVTAGSTWTFASAIDAGNPPQATGALTNGNQFVIRVASQLGQTYRVERSDSLNPAAWVPVGSALPGTGNLLEILDTGGLPEQRFYRATLLSP